MAVQYIRVNPVIDLFAPVVRGTGNLAIVGPVTPPIPAGAAPTIAATAGVGGGFPAGAYSVAYSEVNATGVQSPRSATANVTLTAGQSIQVTAPALATGAVSRNFYITAAPAGVNIGLAGAATTQAFTIPAPPASGAASGPDLLMPNVPVAFTNAADALRRAPGDLGNSIALAFQQTPGPPLVYGVRTGDGPDWTAALDAVAILDVQLVALAKVPLDATSGNASSTPPGAIAQLSTHVTTVSNTGGDGQERMGIAMLTSGSTGVTGGGGSIVSGSLVNERMVYVAHKSTEDVAAAVAGTIAGYPPSTSLLLKQVDVDSSLFSPAEIVAINGTETFDSGPAGQGINWLASPTLLPGHGIYMGEGYTGNPAGKKYIDIVRTVDDVSFKLKAQLIRTVGNLQISRSGLRGLRVQMQAVLDPLIRQSEIENYAIDIPILDLLDRDPSSLTDAQLQEIHDAQSQRLVEVVITVDYAGAIHRIAITLKFE